jgi:thiamine-phosphate pyrophosphorylase
LHTGDSLHLLGYEVSDIGILVHVEFHQQIEITSGRIDLRGYFSIRKTVGDLIRLAELTFDLHEKGYHAHLRATGRRRYSIKSVLQCRRQIKPVRGFKRVKRIDLRLIAIIDPERASGRDLIELARRVVEGGATMVQLRDKRSETRALVEEARAIKAALAGSAVSFVVNDRVDVALAAELDGVHLGPDDMAVEDARRLLGVGAIIGGSIKTVEAAEAVPPDLIDYAGIGGVYATLSKQQKSAPIGTEGLARVAAVLRRRAPALPLAGIAGIDAESAGMVIAAGADGVAAISALSAGPDPAAAARRLRDVVDAMLAKRGV